MDSTLYFHHHVDYIFFQAVRLLYLIRSMTFILSSRQSLLMLHCTRGWPKLGSPSGPWNSIPATDASKLEHIQRKFLSLCHHRFFFKHSQQNYVNALNHLKFRTLSARRRHPNPLYFLNVQSASELPCPFGNCRPSCAESKFGMFLIFYIFVNCIWVDTRWQQCSTQKQYTEQHD